MVAAGVMIAALAKAIPCSAAHAAVSRALAGEAAVRSTSVRRRRVSPSGRTIDATAAASITQTSTTGLACAAAAAVGASAAPVSTSAAALPGVRFQTVVGCPADSNARASARPIGPSPSTVTGMRPRADMRTP